MLSIRNASALLTILAISACDRGPEPFRMTVENVQSMRGFVLKGLGVAGTVEQGCIANYDAFVVLRNGKVVYEEKASIMSLDGVEGFEAGAGHKVEFYLGDAADGAVAVGDVLEAEVTTCGKSKDK
jgi:translation elongation factor EF-Tu-like GTPase